MPNRQPLILVTVAMSMGIAFDRFVDVPRILLLTTGALAVFVWLWAKRYTSPVFTQWPILLATFSTAAAWHDYNWRLFDPNDLWHFTSNSDQVVCIRATALQSPRHIPGPPFDPLRGRSQSDRTRISVSATAIRQRQTWVSASGQASLTVNGRLHDIHAGDELQISAVLSRISGPLNPGEPDFAEFERSHRRLCRLFAPHVECVSVVRRGSKWNIRRWFDAARKNGESMLLHYVGADRGGLAAAIILGCRENLLESDTQAYFKTGMVHVLAISGMNVGILAYGLWFLVRLGWLSRRISLLATSTIVFAYAYLTGAEPPILRAAVLVGSVCCAKYLGRRGIDFNTLALAGVFVLCVNPSYVFQIGTQLSFLAVGVLASIGPRITERLRPVQTPLHRLIESTESRPRRWTRSLLRETVTVCLSSLAVWIVTTPLVWYRFQLISPSALILNPAAWIPIATAMYSGFGILLLGEICGWLGNVLGIICHWSLIAITGLIGTALEWPGNHVFLPGPPLWWTVLFYVGCAARQVLSSARLRLRWTGAIVLVWIAGAVWLSPAGVRISCPRNYLRITFLAVGHGGAVVVEFADGSVLLYDCGRMAAPGLAHRTTAGFLASQGITHLDAVVVSHADTDHFNGLPALMQRVSIGALYLSQQMERQPSASVQILRVAAKGAGIRQQTLQLGDTLVSPSGTRVRVLHPPPSQSEREYRSSNDNSNSIVLEISHQGKRLLLTGDLEKDGLERLLSHFAGDYSIVLIPHHGSVRSNPQRFSEWSGATWGVICGDDSNDVRRTMQIYESQGVIPLHTQDQGAIQFEIREDRISVTSFGQHQCPLF